MTQEAIARRAAKDITKGYDIQLRIEMAIKEALAQEQEPEWYHGVDEHGCNHFYHKTELRPSAFSTPLYTTPPQRTEPVDYEELAALGWQAIECGICGGSARGYPQRTWVELTNGEIEEIKFKAGSNVFSAIMFTNDKLEEKNNG
jgi:hypothetical protein